MNKTRVLGIGIGQAGNILLDQFMSKDSRYQGLFINSAYDDMSSLSNFNYEKNAFTFPGENGSGRDREKAKTFVIDNIKSLADIFTKYPLQDVVIVFFSTDGGTGSGTSSMILQTLRRTCPHKKINVVAVLPNPEESDDISLQNSLECCAELAKIDDLLDDIKFIDNSKGNNYDEINIRAVNDLHDAFSINGKHKIGNIDDGDSKRVNTDKGYGCILRLKDREPSPSIAIDNAVKDTIFALPDSYDCNYLGVSVKEEEYNVEDLKHEFSVEETTYMTYNNKFNLLVLSGCSAPNESIEYIKLKLEEIREKNSNKPKKKKLAIDINPKNIINKEKNNTKIEKVKTTYSEDELDKMVDDIENMFR